jgi:hypothetical protein
VLAVAENQRMRGSSKGIDLDQCYLTGTAIRFNYLRFELTMGEDRAIRRQELREKLD